MCNREMANTLLNCFRFIKTKDNWENYIWINTSKIHLEEWLYKEADNIIVWSELPQILHFFLKLYFAFFSAPSSFWILGRAYSYRENYALSRSKKN